MDLRLDRGGLNLIRDSLNYATSDSSCSEGSIHVQTGSLENLSCKNVPDDTCPVCMEPNNNVLLLPCQHQFHADCILKWTERRFACPLCRTEISHFVPLKQMKSEVTNAMNNVWEKHYVTTQPAREPETPPKYKASPASPPLKRCTSQAQLCSPVIHPKPAQSCKMCSDSLENDYIYMAFDFAFCSSQCRLRYARANKTPKEHEVDGTTSFYVDHSQLEKFFRPPPPIPAQEMSV